MKTEWSSEKQSARYLCVNSCGMETSAEQDIPTRRPHGRVDWHILYVEKGVCRLRSAAGVQEAPQGSILLFRPGEPQDYCFLARYHSVSRYVHFSGTGCAELIARLFAGGGTVYTVGSDAVLLRLFHQMMQETLAPRPFCEDAAAASLYALLVRIGRLLCGGGDEAAAVPDSRIERVCRRIHQEYPRDVPMAEYAADCCLSLSRFLHLFAQNMGVSPARYRNTVRLSRAMDLLQDTDLSVADIAALTGFAGQNYFTRVFSAAAGCTPTQFRRAQQR